LRTLRTIALAGITTLPNIMNSRTAVIAATRPRAHGRRSNSDWLVSMRLADWPVTSTSQGASASRIACTRSSPASDTGSHDGITDRYVGPSGLKPPHTGQRAGGG